MNFLQSRIEFLILEALNFLGRNNYKNIKNNYFAC